MKDNKKIESIISFYRNNKVIIKIKESEFKRWIVDNYYANLIKNNFIATLSAVDNGYMVNKKGVYIDLESLVVYTSYRGYITQLGKQHIIDIFKNKEVNDEGK